jgi:hypothetical protein
MADHPTTGLPASCRRCFGPSVTRRRRRTWSTGSSRALTGPTAGLLPPGCWAWACTSSPGQQPVSSCWRGQGSAAAAAAAAAAVAALGWLCCSGCGDGLARAGEDWQGHAGAWRLLPAWPRCGLRMRGQALGSRPSGAAAGTVCCSQAGQEQHQHLQLPHQLRCPAPLCRRRLERLALQVARPSHPGPQQPAQQLHELGSQPAGGQPGVSAPERPRMCAAPWPARCCSRGTGPAVGG